MASYPIPPWLSPSAAQGYGELAGSAAKAALSAQLEREQMSQRAAQFAIEAQQRSQQTAAEMQARQEQLNYEHQMEQQKIAMDQAYKQQSLALDQQQMADTQAYRTQEAATAKGHLDLAQKEWDEKTKQAAARFTANQAFQKAILPKDQGGLGMSTTEAALQYMAPYMTGTELARLSAVGKPFQMGMPQDIPGFPGKKGLETSKGHFTILDKGPDPNAALPAAIPETGSDGDVIGYWVQPPGGGPMRYQPAKSESGSDKMLKERMAAKGKTEPKPAPKSTAVDVPKLGKNEVIRIVNGRQAVFDSTTKQFVRWADDKAADAK